MIEQGKNISIESVLGRGENKPEIYSEFVNCDNFENKYFDLKNLGVAPAYPLLSYLNSYIPKFKTDELLNFIENWFIRRYITGYPKTNKLNKIFQELISKITKYDTPNLHYKIIKFLTRKDHYMHNDKFKEFLLDKNFHNTNPNAVRCLLIKLEKSKRLFKTNFWELSKKKKLIWSVEHILPQSPHEKSNWHHLFSDDEIEKYVHCLGNLTLTCNNSSLSNKSFNAKIKDSDIGLISGNIRINNYIINMEKHEDWTKDKIINRGKYLADDIINLLNVRSL